MIFNSLRIKIWKKLTRAKVSYKYYLHLVKRNKKVLFKPHGK